MGQTRIRDDITTFTRAKAINVILWCKDHLALPDGQVEDGFTSAARESLQEARRHKNYHVRIAAWKAQGCPLPSTDTHEGNLVAQEALAKELQPNQVDRYFKQQDMELEEVLGGISGNPESVLGDIQRAKDFSKVMRQQYIVLLLNRLSGKGAW